jgi:PhnB protein
MAGLSPASGTLTPYLIVKNAAKAIAFYEKAFGAKEDYRLAGPEGEIGHAELTVGVGRFMLADEHPAFGALAPPSIGGSPVRLHLYVEDVDATIARAEKEGATVLRPAQDQFYGDRAGMIADPFGHQWHLGTRKENVTPDEMRRRYQESFGGG